MLLGNIEIHVYENYIVIHVYILKGILVNIILTK